MSTPGHDASTRVSVWSPSTARLPRWCGKGWPRPCSWTTGASGTSCVTTAGIITTWCACRVVRSPDSRHARLDACAQDSGALHAARVVIYNGAGVETWLEKLRPEFPARGIIVNASDGLPLAKGIDEQEGGAQGEPPARFDPHVWLDPQLAARMVTNVAGGLQEADPQGSESYQARASSLREQLLTLHNEFAARLRSCRQKEFITTHAAFGYLARRYGLVQLPISGLSPEAEPAPARLRELVHLARAHHIKVVYYETLVSPKVAETLAREVGARVLALDPLEGLTSEELRQGRNYFSVMHENLNHLADGLDCH